MNGITSFNLDLGYLILLKIFRISYPLDLIYEYEITRTHFFFFFELKLDFSSTKSRFYLRPIENSKILLVFGHPIKFLGCLSFLIYEEVLFQVK
jgi:hypothetical protein